jgi:hypothetical protein
MHSRRRLSWQPVVYVVGGWFAGCGGSPPDAVLGTDGRPLGPVSDGGNGGAAVQFEAMAPPSEPTGNLGTTADANADDATNGFVAPAPIKDGAPPPPLFVADSAPTRAASDCDPGTYTGTFVMMVGFGGLSTGTTLMGTLSIALEANKPTPHPGEFNTGTLTVAPGAMFSGTDNYGDVWSANISGQLDCGSGMFVGSLTNGVAHIFGIDAATIMLDGSLSATYQPSANPVALVNGSISLSSPQVANTTGMGTWSAALQ